MKSSKSNRPLIPSRRQGASAMTVESLIDTPSELTNSVGGSKCAIVLMTRIRLARNLAGRSFPGWAEADQREEILAACRGALTGVSQMKRSLSVGVAELDDALLGAVRPVRAAQSGSGQAHRSAGHDDRAEERERDRSNGSIRRRRHREALV